MAAVVPARPSWFPGAVQKQLLPGYPFYIGRSVYKREVIILPALGACLELVQRHILRRAYLVSLQSVLQLIAAIESAP
jgi:hypothetical protein